MKKLVFISFLFCLEYSLASPLSPYTEKEKEVIVRQGQFLTLRLVRTEPIRLYIIGREEARFDPKSFHIQVRRLNPYPARDLPIRFEEDYYVLSLKNKNSLLNEIEITTTTPQSKEIFKIDLKNP